MVSPKVKFHLYDFSGLAMLDERLRAVTAEQIAALEPLGSNLPSNAIVLGYVPEPLKALMVLNDEFGDMYYPILEFELRRTFPNLKQVSTVSFGPNFEVFYLPKQSTAEKLDIDLGEAYPREIRPLAFDEAHAVGHGDLVFLSRRK